MTIGEDTGRKFKDENGRFEYRRKNRHLKQADIIQPEIQHVNRKNQAAEKGGLTFQHIKQRYIATTHVKSSRRLQFRL